VINGMETYLKTLDRLEPGDNAGVLVKGKFSPLFVFIFFLGVNREQLRRGMAIVSPGSVKPALKVEANIYILTDEVALVYQTHKLLQLL
jgi:elongation factor Tu